MSSASRIAHEGLPFANPMSTTAVDAALATLPLPAGGRILDTGCGNGELLARAVRSHAGSRGLGVDLDRDAIADARLRAGGLAAEFELRDAAGVEGGFDAAINVAASHALGGFPAALRALRALAPVILYGEGYWRHRPSPEFLRALGDAREDELADLDGLRAAIGRAGLAIVHEAHASERDWADYEETLAANAERAANGERPATAERADALDYARRIRARRALPDGADTLGFALFVLRAA